MVRPDSARREPVGKCRQKPRRGLRPFRLEQLEHRLVLSATMGNAIEVYHEDFESGDGGFVVDNTGGTLLGLWHHSLGRHLDGLPNHSPFHSFYYGAGESPTGGGRFDTLPFDHQGTITSPQIQLPASGATTLMFNYLLDTRPDLDVDFVEVRVTDGTTVTTILSRAAGTLPETNGAWDCLSVDISQFNGSAIQLIFSFDTGDIPRVDPEGWYVDDIWISNLPPTGHKFLDVNGDGMRDLDGADNVLGTADDEIGLEGWEIRAYTDDGDGILQPGERDSGPVATSLTGPDGSYTLPLDPGNYILLEVLQPTWLQTAPTNVVNRIDTALSGFGFAETVTAGNPLMGRDFGNVQPDIWAYVWDDLDADGVWDPGEPGLNDQRVLLDTDGDGVGDLDFVTRFDGQHDGAYWFIVPDGSYRVTLEPTLGRIQTFNPNGAGHDVTVPPQAMGAFEATQAPNFGSAIRQEIALSGRKVNDLNGDGVLTGDPTLELWSIAAYADVDGNGMLDVTELGAVPVAVAITNAAGEWAMNVPANAAHVIVEVLQEHWRQSVPDTPVFSPPASGFGPNGYAIPANSPDRSDLDFGNFDERVRVTGTKFHDRNADGTQQQVDNEESLQGWVIAAYTDTNGDGFLDDAEFAQGAFDADITDANGNYQLDLVVGKFVVVEVLQPRWEQTSPTQDVIDQSIRQMFPEVGNGQTGRAGHAVMLMPGDPPPTFDFGNRLLEGTLSGVKYEDLNGDGDRDLGEPLLEGWTILLFQAGQEVAQATTGPNGEYEFRVLAGDYSVREQLQDGWMQSQPPCTVAVCEGYDRTVLPGQAIADLDFGNFRFGSLSGVKFDDADGSQTDRDPDGADDIPGNDDDENGLIGWTIRAYRDLNSDGFLSQDEIAVPPAAESVSNTNGEYSLDGLMPGDYIVVEVVRTDINFVATFPPREIRREQDPPLIGPGGEIISDLGHAITLPSGQQVVDVNFGNDPNEEVVISGFKFRDLNNNGQNDGEPRVEGTEIRLYSGTISDSSLVASLNTNSLGGFTFNVAETQGIFPLIVVEVIRPNEEQTAPAAGGTGPIGPIMSPPGERFGEFAYILNRSDFVANSENQNLLEFDDAIFGNRTLEPTVTKRRFLASFGG